MSDTSRSLRPALRAVCSAIALVCAVPVATAAQRAPGPAAPTSRSPDGGGSIGVVVLPAGRAGGAIQRKTGAKVGRVVGKLTDAVTGESLAGGQVGVKGLLLGNVSNESGAYFINNVPVGRQTFTVEYLGYASQARKHDVAPGDSNTLDFSLSPAAIAVGEVIVEEDAAPDLTEHVENAPAPVFKFPTVRALEIEKPDTTAMETWRRAWADYAPLHAIEYPLLNERVYFRRPAPMASPETASDGRSAARESRQAR